MKIEVTGLAELSAGLAATATRAKDKQKLFDVAGKYMTRTEIPMIFRQEGPGWPKGNSPGKTLQKTGRLRNSVDYIATQEDLTIGTTIIYGGVHQEGKTIKVRNVNWLTIPANSLSDSERKNFRLRDYENVFFRQSKNGNLIAFQNTGKGEVRMLATLKQQVKMPTRKFLYWSDRAIKGIARKWANLIAEGKIT